MSTLLPLIRLQARALWADKLTLMTLLASGIFAWVCTVQGEPEVPGLPAAVAVTIAPVLGMSVRGRGIAPSRGGSVAGYPAPGLPTTRATRTLAAAIVIALLLGSSAGLWYLTGLPAWAGARGGTAGVAAGLALMVGGGALGAATLRDSSGRMAGVASLAVPAALGLSGVLGSVAGQVSVAAGYLAFAFLLPEAQPARAVASATPLGARARSAGLSLLRLHPLKTAGGLLVAALAARAALVVVPPSWRDTIAACIVMGLVLGALFLPQLALAARPDPIDPSGTATLTWLPIRPRHAWLQLLFGRILMTETAFFLSVLLLRGRSGVEFVSDAQLLRGLIALPAAAVCVSIAFPLRPLAPSPARRIADVAGLCASMIGAVWVWGPNPTHPDWAWIAAAALLYAAILAFWTWRRIPGTLLA